MTPATMPPIAPPEMLKEMGAEVGDVEVVGVVEAREGVDALVIDALVVDAEVAPGVVDVILSRAARSTV
jgi:hypothetical protein